MRVPFWSQRDGVAWVRAGRRRSWGRSAVDGEERAAVGSSWGGVHSRPVNGHATLTGTRPGPSQSGLGWWRRRAHATVGVTARVRQAKFGNAVTKSAGRRSQGRESRRPSAKALDRGVAGWDGILEGEWRREMHYACPGLSPCEVFFSRAGTVEQIHSHYILRWPGGLPSRALFPVVLSIDLTSSCRRRPTLSALSNGG